MIRVSIITVCLNAASTLERCLASVASQGEGVEHIVIDGGSSDGSLDVIARHASNLAHFETRSDEGIFDALNKGLAHATGAVIGIAHSDDYLEPAAVAAVREAFVASGGNAVLAGMARVHAPRDIATTFIPPAGGDLTYESQRGMPISHAAMFVPRAVYERLGQYDSRYRYAADYEFVLRCLRAGVPFKKMDAVLSNFTLGGRSARYAKRMLKEERCIKIAYGACRMEAWFSYFRSRLSYSAAYLLMRTRLGSRIYFNYLRTSK